MDPINQFSPANVADWGKLSPARLLLLVILWHAENTKLNLWPGKDSNAATYDRFQSEWNILCSALTKKLDEVDARSITFSTIKKDGGQKVVAYSFSERSLQIIAHNLGLTLNETLFHSMFPSATART